MAKKLATGWKITIIVVSAILALILIAVITFFILASIGKSKFHKNDRDISASNIEGLEVDDGEVTYNGKKYTLDSDVVSVLFLGVDKDNIGDDFGIGNNGQADTIFVMTLNTATKAIKIIPIPRESMVDVNVFSPSGKYTGTQHEQICLSYAYGKDANDSSENTRKSVSRFLLNINVSNYVTMDLKGISAMTDTIGGVSLTAIEDIPELGCKAGDRLNLNGEKARIYLQSRTEDAEGSSLRMQRQMQFLSEFASKAGNRISGNLGLVKTYYDTMKPYISTDLAFSQITYLVSTGIAKDLGGKFDYQMIDGEKKVGEKWVEFYPDPDSLVTAILNTFYKEK
ncbi:MAG: LCP family protein [Clostridia bacterium]|nr:LCP family protein [Clostridia bacterium]